MRSTTPGQSSSKAPDATRTGGIADLAGPFDVFVNSFSFQEMEPDVVEHYVSQVASKQVSYVVSLNSRKGKPKIVDGHE